MPGKTTVAYGRALYYPYIEFHDEKWVKAAALYYEGIDRIVPGSVIPRDTDFVKKLQDEEGFTRQLDPMEAAEQIAPDFFGYAGEVLQEQEQRGLLLHRLGIHYQHQQDFSLHIHKVGLSLQRQLPALGLALPPDPSHPLLFKLEGATAAMYMTYLAQFMANERNLPLVTDDADFQVLLRRAPITPYPAQEDKGPLLASMVVESVVPRDLANISADQIIAFRRRYKDERALFYDAVRELVSEMETMDHPEAIRDFLERKQHTVLHATRNLERAYTSLKISTATALLSLSVPAFASGLGPGIAAGAVVAVAVGRAVGTGLDYFRNRKSSPYAYVLALKHQLDKEKLASQLIAGKLIL